MNRSEFRVEQTRVARTRIVKIAAVAALALLLSVLYVKVIRPGQLRWGATDEEVTRLMPEDSTVAHPAFGATRAITIHGTPAKIWPWLAQMGYRRAGFYGYDLIENIASGTGISSARKILPQFQNPHKGDELPISAVATLAYGSVEKDRYVVWRGTEVPPNGVFIWELVPLDDKNTRLISRIRWSYHQHFPARALDLFTEFGDHVAVKAILQGIRDRVEGRPPESITEEAGRIAAWLVAMFELAVGSMFVLLGRRWWLGWLLALGAGLLLLFVLYGPDIPWVSAALPWLYLAVMIWWWWRERNDSRRSALPI